MIGRAAVRRAQHFMRGALSRAASERAVVSDESRTSGVQSASRPGRSMMLGARSCIGRRSGGESDTDRRPIFRRTSTY